MRSKVVRKPYSVVKDTKSYQKVRKFRLIAEVHFSYAKRRDAVHSMFGSKLSQHAIDNYFKARGITRDQDEVRRAIEWVFSTPYNPGRFNDESFPALYTGKDEATCVAEKAYYLREAGVNRLEYVLFYVEFSGRLLNLRARIADNRWEMPIEHSECQVIGHHALLDTFDGIAAPSARLRNGNCCVIFTKKAISSGGFVRTGVI
jgi:RES domain